MKKVYCIIFDYQGYEEQLQAIYETKEEAIAHLMIEFYECEYNSMIKFMNDGELSLIEWECGSNNRQVITPNEEWKFFGNA